MGSHRKLRVAVSGRNVQNDVSDLTVVEGEDSSDMVR